MNAAASSAELAPLAERLSAQASVALLDLPGFGDAPRPCHRYAIEDYVAAIAEAQRWVAEAAGQAPVLCALSLSAEFAARAVLWGAPKPPPCFGFPPRGSIAGPCGGASPWRHRSGDPPSGKRAGLRLAPRARARALELWLATPPLGDSLLSTPHLWALRDQRGALARRLRGLSGARSGARPPSILERSTVFPGRRGALSGAHRSADDHPWVPGDFQDYRGASALAAESQGRVQVHALDTGALPHIEAPQAFASALHSSLGAMLAPIARAS